MSEYNNGLGKTKHKIRYRTYFIFKFIIDSF